MRFKNLGAEGFGCFKNWESPEINSNLVVFYGPNEAGKSTLFNLVSTLLYGWSPASRDSNPYVPWDGTQASCMGVIRGDSGEVFSVYRRLKGRPEGLVTAGETSTQIGNNAIEHAASLPREIFSEVCALTLDELRFPNDRVWQRMQDQLLGGQYNTLLYPIRDIILQLENESNNLWRHDKRGNPRDRQLKAILSELNQKLKEVSDNEKKLYASESELGGLHTALLEKLEQKSYLTAYIDRYERLNPIRKKLDLIRELECKAGDIASFETLPQEVGKVLGSISDRRKELYHKREILCGQIEKSEGMISRYSSFDRAVISLGDRIRTESRLSSQSNIDLQEYKDLEMEIRGCQGQISSRAMDFISGGWKDEYGVIVRDIDEAGLRTSIDLFRKAEYRYQEYKARAAGLKSKSASAKTLKTLPWIGAVLAAAGAICLLMSGLSILGFVSGMAAMMGLSLLIIYFLIRGRDVNTSELKAADSILKEAETKLDDARGKVRKYVEGFPVSEMLLKNPGEGLLLDVSRLKGLLESIDRCLTKKNVLESHIAARRNRIEELFCALRMNTGDVPSSINMLEGCLKEAEEHYRNATDARARLEDLGADLKEIEEEIANLDAERSNILSTIDNIEGDSLDEKISNLLERRRLKAKSDALKEELERVCPDIQDVEEEIAASECEGTAWTFNDEAVVRAKTELGQLDMEINEINEKIGSMKKDVEYMLGKERLDDVKGQIEAVDNEIKSIRVKRDRIELLKNIIIEADRRFREEHQPDVLKKAGRHLDIITGGRYNGLYMNDEGSRTFSVKYCNDDFPVEITKPLSRGTKEQVYLALRLALIEHLDSTGEKLPVFLDEALVNWDVLRLQNLACILNEITSNRQVFLFTCHEPMIDMLGGVDSLQVIELN